MDGYTIVVEKDSHGCVAVALDDGCNVVGIVTCPEAHDARRRLQCRLDCGPEKTRVVVRKRHSGRKSSLRRRA